MTDVKQAGQITEGGTVCANCGEPIPPNSQVVVLKKNRDGSFMVCHTTYDCSPPGGAFYGFWGEGKLVSSFDKIEQC
jgi:hypothetical protein